VSKIEKIVIATKNPAKKKRYAPLLAKYAKYVLDLTSFKIDSSPSEDGVTAEENARIKALFYARKTKTPAFSIDEALLVDFLPESLQPGVFVRRINGKDGTSDETLLEYWKEIISKVDKAKRTGHWHIAYCIAYPTGISKTVAVDTPIMFFFPPSKTIIPGWPMSSLQGPIKFKKPHSELSEEEREDHDKEANTKIESILKNMFEQK